ncbi:MAG: hypothetical protein ACXQS8_00680 [Candidatus Helarchaeales archaeon]
MTNLQEKLEKTARSINRIGKLVGPALSSILPISNSSVYFNVRDGDSYTLEIAESSARVVEGKSSPITLELIATEEAFMKWIDGKRSFEALWVNGEIEIVSVRNNLLKALIIGMFVGM